MSNKNSIFSPVFKYKAPVLNLERRWCGVDPRIQRHVVTGLNHEEPNFVQQDIPRQACCKDNCDCTNGRDCPSISKVVEPFHAGFSKTSLARRTNRDRAWYKQGHPRVPTRCCMDEYDINCRSGDGCPEIVELFGGVSPKVAFSKKTLTYLLIIIIIIYLASKYIKHSK